jgi:PKD repeat protein
VNGPTISFVARTTKGQITDSGTTATTFIFQANVQSENGSAEIRWDFDGDKTADTYFSSVYSYYHQYSEPGVYQVTLEALDRAGNVSSVTKTITVVKNDAPTAYFKVDKINAPINSIITFDTALTSDNQYQKNDIYYRFDWNGDGVYDTPYNNKTVWKHLFKETGKQTVIMQATDLEGLSSRAKIIIKIVKDAPPKPVLKISNLSGGKYFSDASGSKDDYTKSLQYRWDFDYQGSNDITFNTSWSNLSRYSWKYSIGGTKTIRLQVMDQQGVISESLAKIEVPWTEQFLGRAYDAIGL